MVGFMIGNSFFGDSVKFINTGFVSLFTLIVPAEFKSKINIIRRIVQIALRVQIQDEYYEMCRVNIEYK